MPNIEPGKLKHVDDLYRCLAQAGAVMAAIRGCFSGPEGQVEQKLSPGTMATAIWAVDDLIDTAADATRALFL